MEPEGAVAAQVEVSLRGYLELLMDGGGNKVIIINTTVMIVVI